jgi:WD40 repeat protein
LSNGEIYYYKIKNIDQKNIFAKGKDPDLQPLESTNSHKGEVRKMIYTPINEGQIDVLISASADRTVKLWDPKNVKGNSCFQTLVGHEGSVLDMVYTQKVDQLITSSTDKTMRIWVIDKQRSIF